MLGQASVVVENICPQQSLVMYFRAVFADFQSRSEGRRLRIRNKECGIKHVTLSHNRYEAPLVKPLIEVKGHSQEDQEGQGTTTSTAAWKFVLIIKSAESAAGEAAGSGTRGDQGRSEGQGGWPAPGRESAEEFDPCTGTSSNEGRLQFESRFSTRQIKVHFQAEVLSNLRKFFQPDQAAELRAQALDKLAQLSAQSQVNLREMIQEQRVSKLDFNVGKIVVEIPFKALNSQYTGEPEEQRARSWHFSLADLNLRTVESAALDDIYERFAVTVSAVGLKFGKKHRPRLLEVIEEFDVALLIKLKSKLKSLLRKDAEGQRQGTRKGEAAE